jgi:ketosteroid isomerase-like protein
MASANLELVRSIFAASERGDFGSVEWADPEIEFVVADGPLPDRLTGPTAMMKAYEGDFLSAWEDVRSYADEYRELDDERVLVLAHYGGRGKASGLDLGQLETKVAALFHIREGRVTRLVLYWDRDRALADLGLPSEG